MNEGRRRLQNDDYGRKVVGDHGTKVVDDRGTKVANHDACNIIITGWYPVDSRGMKIIDDCEMKAVGR